MSSENKRQDEEAPVKWGTFTIMGVAVLVVGILAFASMRNGDNVEYEEVQQPAEEEQMLPPDGLPPDDLPTELVFNVGPSMEVSEACEAVSTEGLTRPTAEEDQQVFGDINNPAEDTIVPIWYVEKFASSLSDYNERLEPLLIVISESFPDEPQFEKVQEYLESERIQIDAIRATVDEYPDGVPLAALEEALATFPDEMQAFVLAVDEVFRTNAACMELNERLAAVGT